MESLRGNIILHQNGRIISEKIVQHTKTRCLKNIQIFYLAAQELFRISNFRPYLSKIIYLVNDRGKELGKANTRNF